MNDEATREKPPWFADNGHTAGPWKIEKEWSNGCEVGPWIMTEPDAEGKRRIVAKVGGAPYLETDKGARVYANARLIAASPLAYALAVEILRALDPRTGYECSEVTRREMEPLFRRAAEYMKAVKAPTPETP